MTAGPISQKLFSLAKQYIPGGVNSPVRAFRNVGGEPRTSFLTKCAAS